MPALRLQPEAPVVIEILHVRDPDGECYLTVWVDGQRVDDSELTVFDVDAGRGYTYEDWKESSESAVEQASTREIKDAVAEAYGDPPGGKYIDGKPDEEDWG